MRAFWREPLLHFLVLGALLFVIYEARGGRGAASTRIVITPGRMEHLSAGFLRTWQRLPNDTEREGLIQDYVREEIASREAAGLGLDADDAIIRHRLRQKFEFLVEDAVEAAPLTEAELSAWYEGRRERFRTEPQISFRQVYVSPERHADAPAEAARLLARLNAGGGTAVKDLGDPLSIPSDIDLVPRSDVVALFGEAFADTLLSVTPGRWQGPLASGYGLHLVFVRERVEGAIPAFAEARPDVEREFLAEKRREAIDALYERLLRKYTVIVERPRTVPASP